MRLPPTLRLRINDFFNEIRQERTQTKSSTFSLDHVFPARGWQRCVQAEMRVSAGPKG